MALITDTTREALSRAEIDGTLLVIPDKLDRADYQAVNKVLTNLGGKWDRTAKGHVFPTDPSENVQAVLDSGEVPAHPRTAEGFVRTPDGVARQIVREHTDLADRDPATQGVPSVLEPSAGDGALVAAIREADQDADITALEPNQARAASIPRDSTVVHTDRLEDYLHRTDARQFDLVVQNPPFSVPGRSTIWIDHVRHAWSLLSPGGRLVSLAPQGLVFRDDRKHRELREWVQRYGGWHELDEDAFTDSGTRVRAVVLWVDKPAGWEPEWDQRKKKRGKPTDEERQERRDEDRQLRQDADDALDDDTYVADLEARVAALPAECRLATYSPRNQALVVNQADALGVRLTGHLNTFKGWQAEGRMVVKGSTALRVVAAMGEEEKPETGGESGEDGEAGEKRKRFRVTTRFDLSQTAGVEAGEARSSS